MVVVVVVVIVVVVIVVVVVVLIVVVVVVVVVREGSPEGQVLDAHEPLHRTLAMMTWLGPRHALPHTPPVPSPPPVLPF